MVVGPSSKARSEYISALVPPSTATKQEQFESGYGSSNSASDESGLYQRAHTAKNRKPRRQTPRQVNTNRPSSVFHNTYQRDPVKGSAAKHQQQPRQSSLDPVSHYCRPKTASSRISIDTKPFQNFKLTYKESSGRNNKQISSQRSDVRTNHSRHLHTPPRKESNVVEYSDDWDSDYSDDWELDKEEIPKPTPVLELSRLEPKASSNSINFEPSDPTAFDASFCRKRQAAIDNMSYRQAVNSWKAKALHDVVKLILDLSSGKNLIDRAWIVFYWVSQNIEYDVEAYFSGNIRHQTSEDVFANRKGVCDAFGTIFETLCTAVQIECKKISGYAKGYSFKLEQSTFHRTNHAWNVIRLDGHWFLVDPTWGEGHLDSNKCNRKELNSFYFLVPPEHMIYRHLPEDPQWQLLAHHVSMYDFVRLPFVYPSFFELDLDVIYPRHSNTASFNSSLGLAEVLIRAPAGTVLMGDIEQTGSGKIKNACLVQYDADRQLWQCLYAPQRGGFHTLTIYGRRGKSKTKNKTSGSSYSCAIQFVLHMSADFRGKKTFPTTYGLFGERKCQIYEPLDTTLKPGSKVNVHCRIPGAYCVRLKLDGNWLSEDLIKDDIFKRQITVPQREMIMYVKFSDQRNSSSYSGLFYCSLQ